MTTSDEEVPPPPLTLRPYQQEMVAAVYDGLRDGGSGQIRMACGSGKTVVGQRAVEQLLPAGGTVAVLVPSLALIAQTLAAWRQNTEQELDVLAVCADDTVADAGVHTGDFPVPVTTSETVIASWLRRPAQGGMRLVLCTHISARRLAPAVRSTAPLDLVILDEAHRFAGRADYVTREILQPGVLPARRRLPMTATPREDLRLHQENTQGGSAPLVGMDDTGVFGPVLGDYPFARGIAEGYLEDYRIAVIGVRDSEARALLAEQAVDYVDAPGGPSLRTVVAQAALARARQQFGIRSVLTFHPRIEAAAEFSRTLHAALDRTAPGERNSLYAAHVHGKMDHRLRERIIARLRDVRDGWTVISNARCLGEGVDVPAVDGVLFAHPKESAVDISQAVGRALRRSPHNPGPATIIVPLVVPDEDGEIGDLEPGDYTTLWHVVRALRAHDEALGTALDATRRHDSTSTPDLPSKITVILPPGTSSSFLPGLKLLLVKQTTSSWWAGYHEAERYSQHHGHLLVPSLYRTEEGFRLGGWIAQARYRQRRGLLSAERIARLNGLGMDWEPGASAFARTLASAATFREQHGHLRVPQAYDTPDGEHLSSWINKQRGRRRKGKLPAVQEAALTALGMEWDPDRVQEAWDTGQAAVRAYHALHGHLDVPRGYITPDGHRLGHWLKTQRTKHRKGILDPAQAAALNELGMLWDPDEARWWHRYEAARTYRAQHEHLNVPHSYTTPDGIRLGSWLLHQRQLRSGIKQGGLSDERTTALDALGIRW